MKRSLTPSYLPPLAILAFLAMVGCTPPARDPTPTPAGLSAASAPAKATIATPVAKTLERSQPTTKPMLPEKLILDGAVLKNSSSGWELEAEGMEALKQTLEKVRSFTPGLTIVVTGYSSSTGARRKNLIISRHRAEFVARTLTSMGVSPEKITVRSLGSSNPIADNATPTGRMKNQRVEIEFQKP